MIIGKMSLPEVLAQRPFDWFVKYYNINLKGNIKKTPEEVYKLLGGTPPAKKENQ